MSENFLVRFFHWLRAGYPDGVPQQDYVALLGLLHRQLTTKELDDIVEALAQHAEDSHEPIGREDIERMVEQKVYQHANEADIARVSARLAAGGWPLASSLQITADRPSDEKAGVLARVVAWLKRGYPGGVPQQDYIPIIALLRRRLSNEEISTVVDILVEDGTLPAEREDIGAAILKVTDQMPTEEDFARVRAHLDESELDS